MTTTTTTAPTTAPTAGGLDPAVERAICEHLANGERLAGLSAKYLLSRERIRQIALQHGAPLHMADYCAPAQVDLIQQVAAEVRRYLDQSEVPTVTMIHDALSAGRMLVDAAIVQAELVPLIGVLDPPEKVVWSEDAMHTALRAAAAAVEGPLTGTAYDALLKEGTITGPSRVLIIQRIGTWSKACRDAGIPYQEPRREYRGRSEADLWGWLHAYAEQCLRANTPITFAGYSAWAHKTKGAPSGSLIKARMSSGTDYTWNTIRDALILNIYGLNVEYWVR